MSQLDSKAEAYLLRWLPRRAAVYFSKGYLNKSFSSQLDLMEGLKSLHSLFKL